MVKLKSKLTDEEKDEYKKKDDRKLKTKKDKDKTVTETRVGYGGPSTYNSGGWCDDEEEEITEFDGSLKFIKSTKGGVEVNKSSYIKKV